MEAYGRSGIYEIRCKVSGDAYVGSSRNIYRRWCGHRTRLRNNIHPTKHLQNAWNKYGEENFEFSVLEYCDADKLVEREQVYLDSGEYVYNKAKFAYNPALGAKLSPEHVARLKEVNTGKVRSAATRKLMSEAQKRDKARPEYKQMARERMLGTTVPQDVRDKIAETLRGREIPEEQRIRMAETLRTKIAEEGINENSLRAIKEAAEKRKGRPRNPMVAAKTIYRRHGLAAANRFLDKNDLPQMTQEEMDQLLSVRVKDNMGPSDE